MYFFCMGVISKSVVTPPLPFKWELSTAAGVEDITRIRIENQNEWKQF